MEIRPRALGFALPGILDSPISHRERRGRRDLDQVKIILLLKRDVGSRLGLRRLVINREVPPQCDRRSVEGLSAKQSLHSFSMGNQGILLTTQKVAPSRPTDRTSGAS